MADLITGNTQLATTKQDLVAAMVQRELAAQAKLMRTVTDVSTFAVKGAKSISFPKLTSFTITNRASGAQGDASQLTAAVDKLDLDQNAYCAWIIDSFDLAQTTIEAELAFAQRAASAHGRYVDSRIVATLEAAGVATATVGAITRDIVLEMREALLTRNANLNALKLVLGVDSESDMLKISQFTEAQIYGSSNVPAGVIGSVYGVEVIVSNLVGANTYYMYESEGIAIGFQRSPQMSEQSANEFGTGAKRVAMDQLFGTKGLQLGVNGVGAAESALIVKDGN